MDAIFFPRQDYQVVVCPHRLGKAMTYTEQSDNFRGGAEAIAYYAISKGLKFGIFWGTSGLPSDAEIAKTLLDAGQLWIDAYCNPEGASGGGQISQSAYEAQRDALIARFHNWYGIRPVTMSFGYGNTTYADYAINDFLACRNSGKTGGTTYGIGYGVPDDIPYSKSFYKSKASSARWYDDAKYDSSFAERLQTLETEILSAKQSGGWFNNFTHWHNVIEDGNLQPFKDYMDLLARLNANNDIYFAGYGEAVAYLVYRQMITRAVMYSPKDNPTSQLIIRLEAQNNLGIDTNWLVVPISVRFSTTGTPLAGKTLTSNCNLINLGNGDYIAEIPYLGRFPYAVVNGN